MVPAAALVKALRETPQDDVFTRTQHLNALADLADVAPNAVREALRFRFSKTNHTLSQISEVLQRDVGRNRARQIMTDLLELAWDLRCEGKSRIVIVNATFDGGGVAEFYQTCAAVLKLLRIDVEWHTSLAADSRFTALGRKVSDLLRGNASAIGDEELAIWEHENARLGRILQGAATDKRVAGIFLEDHQPVHLIEHLQTRRHAAGTEEPLRVVWRSHLDNAGLLAGADAPTRLWTRVFKPQLERLGPADAALFQPGSVPRDAAALACGVFTQNGATTPAAMCRLYLGLCRANARSMAESKGDVRAQENAAPMPRLVDYVMNRKFKYLGSSQ